MTGPNPKDEPPPNSAVRLPLRNTVTELFLGAFVAAVLSLLLQFAIVRIGISEPSYAPEALAAVGSGLILTVVFLLLAFGRHGAPRWVRLASAWLALSAFNTVALAIPLQATRFYFGGSTTDNGFRMQYMTRMASTAGLADMNYADTAPYYPAGWFWLGGRFANVIGWEGWAAYKPYALTWVAVTSVVAFTLWSLIVRRRVALLAALATSMAGMLHGIEEPYAWPSAAWLPPIAILTWQALRREPRAPRWALWCIGCYVGFAAITYTLHFAFAVLVVVTMAAVIAVMRARDGASVGLTVKRLFFRLVPIGAVSAVIALLVWLPYLISTSFLLNNPRSAAQQYLPEDSAFLPVPMTESTVFGALCLAGMVWLLLRCRHNEIAAALLAVVLAVYCWFGLSTLALLAKTTLLAFRLNVILDAVLATAGILGLLELIGYLRHRLDARHTFQIATVSCALGLIGAVALTQYGIGEALAKSTKKAYEDYYPTGNNAMGHQDPAKSGSWTDELTTTIARLSRRPPEQNVVLSTEYKLMSYQPYWGFQQETPHYANPLADYDKRADAVKRWSSAKTSAELSAMLRTSAFKTPNVFVFRKHSTAADKPVSAAGGSPSELSVTLKGDAFPQAPNVRDYDVVFDSKLFESPEFVQHDVGPYTVIARR